MTNSKTVKHLPFKEENLETLKKIASYAKRLSEIDTALDEQGLNDEPDSLHIAKLEACMAHHHGKIKELFFGLKDNNIINKGIVLSGYQIVDSFTKVENILKDQDGIFVIKPEFLPSKLSEITILSNDEKHLDNLADIIRSIDKNIRISMLMDYQLIDEFINGGKISFGSSTDGVVTFDSVKDLSSDEAIADIAKAERRIMKPKKEVTDSQKNKKNTTV